MASLQQPLPLNHPRPQPSSQPPPKKFRLNAKPKLTLDQITHNQVVQSALRVGRRARANPPKPGEEHQALDKLLKRMQAWSHQVAPQYSLAEFLVAAQGIAGNRELRPILGIFRLAELRDVTAHDPPHQNTHPDHPHQHPNSQNQSTNTNPAPVHAQVGPDDADVGPVEADVAPDDNDWDELDIVPHQAVEVRPLSNPQSQSPVGKRDGLPDEPLDSDVEARIERNRLAALERRKAAMARVNTERTEQVENNKPTPNPDTPSPPAPQTQEPSTDSNVDKQPEPTVSNPQVEQPKPETSRSKLASSEKEMHLAQKSKSGDGIRVKMMTTESTEDEKTKVPSEEPNASEDKGRNDGKESALQQTDGPGQAEERTNHSDEDSCPTELKKNICEDKAGLLSINESVETTGASANQNDQGIDMEILAEFQEGGEV